MSDDQSENSPMLFSVATNRLQLRDFLAADWPFYAQLFKEPEIQSLIPKYQLKDEYALKLFAAGLRLAKYRYRRSYLFTIVHRESGELVGTCSLISAITHSRETQIGWQLSARYSEQGFASEVGRCLLKIGFVDHLVALIRAELLSESSFSIDTMREIGMYPYQNGWVMRWCRGFKYKELRPYLRYQVDKTRWLANQEHLNI